MKADMMAAQEAARKKAVATGDFPGSWKMPGTNTSVSFSGYVKLDAIYDFDQGNMGDSFVSLRLGGAPSRDSLWMAKRGVIFQISPCTPGKRVFVSTA